MTHVTQLNWYALKVFYNKVFEVEQILFEHNVENYIPTEVITVMKNGVFYDKKRPVVNSLMFLRTSPENLTSLLRGPLYNRALVYRTPDRQKPAIIPDRDFYVFRLVTSSGETGLEYFCDEQMIHLSSGDKVRVIDGPFIGTEGYVKRIRRDRRVLVVINGIVAVATSYIPSVFLEKIE